MTAALPLQHLRVLDLSRVRAGPTCVRQLSDWGAEVIKIEGPEDDGFGGNREGPDFQNLHRNKRSMTLNLKEPEGRAILLKLVEQADVLVENYRPDVKHRLKIDYETLRAINPRLIYASISGFGQDGPYRRPARRRPDRAGHGRTDDDHRRGRPRADARRHRHRRSQLRPDGGAGHPDRTDRTRQVGRGPMGPDLAAPGADRDARLPGRALSAQRRDSEQVGNDHPTGVPSSAYATQDGYINISAPANYAWKRLCDAIGAPELVDKPGYDSFKARAANRKAVNATLAEIFRTKSTEHWVTTLNDAGVPCGPIYTMDQVFADPQVQHLGIAQTIPHPTLGSQTLIGQAVTLSRTPSRLRSPSPEKGEHTADILRELGYDDAGIAGLSERGVL